MKVTKKKLLEAPSNNTAIVTHIDPDGDGLPASLALKWIMRSLNIETDFILEEGCSEIYNYLDCDDNVKIYNSDMIYQTLILVDCHEKNRIGKCKSLIKYANQIITIDHHPQNSLIHNSHNLIKPNFVSAGAIIFDIFENEINDLDFIEREKIVAALYTTFLNDSGNFTNANMDSRTFEMSAKLVKLGLIPGDVSKYFLSNKPINQMKFVGEVLSTIQTFDNEQIVFIESTKEMLKRNNLNKDATSSMTNWIKGTRNTKVIVYFREIDEKVYKLSLRSKFIN
ncbi:MAG: DHH family phosphoesterase, partial [Candidatus Cloacimonadota bacterium]|nr:DHH family phosphoesterase [Candidatus Cloacimonadota bacterium]